MKKYQYIVKDFHDTLLFIEKSEKIKFGLIAYINKLTIINNYHVITQLSIIIIGIIKIVGINSICLQFHFSTKWR